MWICAGARYGYSVLIYSSQRNKFPINLIWWFSLPTRVGWKVHRMTKKELCHSSDTWHALNSTFWDAYCIVSFQRNPHWMIHSGLWKVVLVRNISKQPGKLMKGVPFNQDNAPAHKSVVAMSAVHDCGFELVDHPPYSPDLAPSIFYSPIWKKTHLAAWEAVLGPMMRLYLQLRTFLRIRMRASIPREAKRYKTLLEEVCGPQGRLC